jgi:alpha-L-arabinofuranosidase
MSDNGRPLDGERSPNDEDNDGSSRNSRATGTTGGSRPSRRTVLRGTALGVLGSAAIPATSAAASSTLTLTVDTSDPGHAVSPDLFGVFFEEINYGGVGGLYPELIRNRAFMDPSTPTTFVATQDIPRVTGEFGNALQLNGGSPAQYVAVPAGITTSLTDFTVATWVNPAAINTWARVFDFGTGETVNMFLTVSAGATPRFAITVSGNGNEQRLNAPSALPMGTWTHLAITLSGTTGTFYVNGTAVDTNTAMTLNPASLSATTQNNIGKSQYPPDPYLDGIVDEFQIYSRALSAAEVASLLTSAGGSPGGGDVAWYRFDETKGAVATDSSGKGNNGTIALVATDWTLIEDGGASATATLDTATPLNAQLTRSLRLDITDVTAGQRAGMANGGYFGVPAVPGRDYRVSFFAKASNGFRGPLTVSLESSDGTIVYDTAKVRGLTSTWARYHAHLRVLRGAVESTTARFVISVDNAPAGTTIWFQVVSLFPPTYRNRPNGLRPDLVELVHGIRPKILRFPGGNYIEGVTVDTRWNWKQTIGPIWERPGHDNSAWGYWSDDGLGLLEFLQLAEDLDATPVMAVWGGLTLNGTVIAEADLAPYVQDALDQIEYAIGPVTSTWGAKRAADGHPEPFGVPYVEVGNEDNLNRGTTSYNTYRYPMFYDAIKAAYPRVKVIATTSVTSRPMDVLDQHFYSSAGFFEAASTLYDGYSRSAAQVFVGEYAGTASAGALPTGRLGNSIGEAAFMTGLERNSDIVHMSSYAPLFAYVGHTQWNPDLIGFDQVTSFGSTSYWVQRMFASNVGNHVLPVTASASGLYYSATARDGHVFLKVVNPGASDVAVSLAFAGSSATRAAVEVLGNPDPSVGNTLAAPSAVTPVRSFIYETGGAFSLTAPANSLSVIEILG